MVSSRRGTAIAATALLAPSALALYTDGSVVAPCDSPLYCHGDILKGIELAQPFADSKTFVDMPTSKPLDQVVAAFSKLQQPLVNNSELNAFLSTYFHPAGGELASVPRSQLPTGPGFLGKLSDTVIKEFVAAVVDIWPDLTRQYVGSPDACTECTSSFIPLKRPFVVAGGRFREAYYWDSYWILQGLLRTGGAFTDIALNIIENFLDLVEQYGFVPNGARLYYLNRSQPPILSLMVKDYVDYTKNTSILARAVPLLIKEHAFWMTNRTVNIAGANGATYTLNQYHVLNNQPRPESYLEDYQTATNQSYYAKSGAVYPVNAQLSDKERADLYANLASGAESGWDYSSRWLARPQDAASDKTFPLRSLNIINLVPVDLNSILYQNEVIIGGFLDQEGNKAEAERWAEAAKRRSEAMSALMWNATMHSYFDYNLTSQGQHMFTPVDADSTADEQKMAPPGYQVLFDAAQLYPFWTGAAADELKNNPQAVRQAYVRVESMLNRTVGGIPATNYHTSQQWDEPNVWPPLQHILMQGLLNTATLAGASGPECAGLQSLALRIAQRYLDSTFCTWYATGGSTSQTPKLPGTRPDAHGIMFEKYADNATDVAGSGGEYTVVEGFGWTNGVLIWMADTFAGQLQRPQCGPMTAASTKTNSENSRRASRSAVELHPADAKWVQSFARRV